MSGVVQLWAWRHPRASGAEGRCIGRSDLAVDRRQAKRLAHRIRQTARREGLPRHVFTSPLQRCAAVGRQLRAWGWQHHVDPALLEMDFGAWDGRRWDEIPRSEIDAWCGDFSTHAPGGGESLCAMFARLAAWRARTPEALLVAHAGCMLAWRHLASGAAALPRADEWPAPPAHGALWRLRQAAT